MLSTQLKGEALALYKELTDKYWHSRYGDVGQIEDRVMAEIEARLAIGTLRND